MAQSSARCSPCQNPLFDDKDELAGGTTIKDNNCCTSAPAVTRALTLTIAPVVAPLTISGFADSSVVRYLKDDLQQIVKTILEAKPLLLQAFAPVPASVVAAAPHYEGSCERPLKPWFPDIYWGKIYLGCYNFFQ